MVYLSCGILQSEDNVSFFLMLLKYEENQEVYHGCNCVELFFQQNLRFKCELK